MCVNTLSYPKINQYSTGLFVSYQQKNPIVQKRLSSNIQKHYNHFQSIFKEMVFTKLFKMPSWEAWVNRPAGLIKVEDPSA